jgi:hypothetical protein
LSVVSENGFINTGKKVWHDQVNQSEVTTWQFTSPLRGFGADWDLVGPSGLRLSVDDQFVGQEIPKGAKGEFFGVTSTSPFQEVLVTGGTQGQGNETYEMDNMVYSSEPLLATPQPTSGEAPPPLSSSPIYNNTTTPLYYYLALDDGQVMGDTVNLAPGPRGMTDISLMIYNAGNPGTADTTVSVHAGGSPLDTQLFSTTLLDYAYPNPDGWNAVTVHTPYVTLPDTVTWTVGFNNRIGIEAIGPLLYDPPTVGSSADHYWLDGVEYWSPWPGLAVANFGAEIKAVVPEPATLLIWSLLAGLGIGVGWRRRRR